MTGIIKSEALIDWFHKCGFPLPPDQQVYRIVIDAKVDEPVKVYIEMFGTTKMLDVMPPDISPTQITIVGAGDKQNGKIRACHSTID